jgi:hypothetical protein
LIRDEIHMSEKLVAIVKRNMMGFETGLNDIKLWGSLIDAFLAVEKRRNAIAHNYQTFPITSTEVDQCFSILAMISGQCFEENSIRGSYGT